MELERAYRQVEVRLERIDFPALHRGFHPFPFKMYPGFRTVGVFDSPHCSDIVVSEIPCLRTPGFEKPWSLGRGD